MNKIELIKTATEKIALSVETLLRAGTAASSRGLRNLSEDFLEHAIAKGDNSVNLSKLPLPLHSKTNREAAISAAADDFIAKKELRQGLTQKLWSLDKRLDSAIKAEDYTLRRQLSKRLDNIGDKKIL